MDICKEAHIYICNCKKLNHGGNIIGMSRGLQGVQMLLSMTNQNICLESALISEER